MALVFFTAAAINVSADEHDGVIDLYPYDEPGCMTTDEPCTRTRVGSANWTYEFNGRRYHAVRTAARYVTEWEDENADGYIDASEITSISWPSFGTININDTDEGVQLITASGRADLLGGVVDRMFAYFNEDGELAMFEDHFVTYYIHNEGDDENPDWRLATQAEIDAFEEAEDPAEDTPNTIESGIRMALSDDHARGYVLEPLTWLSWYRPGVDPAEDDVEDLSLVVDYDPEIVNIPAGWTVVTFGTLDRDGTNQKTLDFITDMPEAMLDDTLDPMVLEYHHQPAEFDGISNLDDDGNTPGVTKVVDYNDTFDFDPAMVTASWLNMFDNDGNIINETEMLDYQILVEQDGVLIQTIDFTWDESAGEYTASEALDVDSSIFGNAYQATFVTETPLAEVTEYDIDIVVGVVPPIFVGVEDRYVDENTFMAVLEGISADDGYGNDISDLIEVTLPSGFNPYNTRPGVYEIGLEFTYNVFIEGDPYYITVNGDEYDWNYPDAYNSETAVNAHPAFQIWDDVELFRDISSGWGSVIVVVDGDGNMSERWDRYTWDYTDETGTETLDGDQFADWQAEFELDEGGFVITAHGSVEAPPLRDPQLEYGDPISFTMGSEDIDEDIHVTDSFTVTVDDVTAPELLVVDDNFTIETGSYANVNQAILANVVAFDNYDTPAQIATYVSNTGGMNIHAAGTYTVSVVAEDRAGNMSTVTFDVTVVEPAITQDDLDAIESSLEDHINAVAGDILSEADVQALIDAAVAAATDGMLTEADVEAMIDDAVSEATEGMLTEDESGASVATVVIVSIVTALAAFSGALVLMIKKPF